MIMLWFALLFTPTSGGDYAVAYRCDGSFRVVRVLVDVEAGVAPDGTQWCTFVIDGQQVSFGEARDRRGKSPFKDFEEPGYEVYTSLITQPDWDKYPKKTVFSEQCRRFCQGRAFLQWGPW